MADLFIERGYKTVFGKQRFIKDIDLLYILYYNTTMVDGIECDGLTKFDRLALAISGGKDSMSLLYYFIENFDKKQFFVVTVHHNLRGKEGERDRDFVVDFCGKHGIECLVFEEDIPSFCRQNNYTVEQGARIRRREIFARLVAQGKAQRVVTAHHCDDQIESILMHIFRGSGIRGLCGMEFDDGILLRPYLKVLREDIDEYVKAKNIPYVDDSTNFCVDYTRNKVRREIVPLIAQAYPGFQRNIVKLGDRAKEIFAYIDSKSKDFELRKDEVFIPEEVFRQEKIIASQTVINAVDAITTRVDLTSKHIDEIIALSDKRNGASINLPFGLTAHRDNKGITLALENHSTYSGIITGYGEYPLNDKVLILSEKEIKGCLRCDLDKLTGATIRNRQEGDSFRRYKGASKSLGDYFTDIKVAKRHRDNAIVIAKGNTVYLLPEYEISDNIKVDENTTNIAYIQVKKSDFEEQNGKNKESID